MVFILKDQIWKYYKTVVVNIFDRCNLFPIARLKNLVSILSIGICNNYIIANNIYYKAGFVEIVEICIVNRIFLLYIVYQLKPYVYKFGIFVKGPLLIVDIQKICFKFGTAIYETLYLIDIGRFFTMYCKKEIGYIFYFNNLE